MPEYRKYVSAPPATEISLKEIAKDFRNEEKLLNPDCKFVHIFTKNGRELTDKEASDYICSVFTNTITNEPVCTTPYKEEDLIFKEEPNTSYNKFMKGANRSIFENRRKDKKLMERVKEYNKSLCMLGEL